MGPKLAHGRVLRIQEESLGCLNIIDKGGEEECKREIMLIKGDYVFFIDEKLYISYFYSIYIISNQQLIMLSSPGNNQPWLGVKDYQG